MQLGLKILLGRIDAIQFMLHGFMVIAGFSASDRWLSSCIVQAKQMNLLTE
jgi:hypothetical protein